MFETKQQQPAKTYETYLRLVYFATQERQKDATLCPSFTLSIKHFYVQQIALKFPEYLCKLLGGCVNDEEEVRVHWFPKYQE